MHAPLTDHEYALLLPLLPRDALGRGRPPADRRRMLDAIFHVALSRRPWREMPAGFGKPDSVCRQLRRWMRAGVMDALLRAAVTRPFASLRHRICRAWRRAARLAGMASLQLARRLAPFEALPCAPWFLPDPVLSAIVHRMILQRISEPFVPRPGLFTGLARLLGFAGGNRRRWARW